MSLITEPGVYELPAHVYHDDPVEGGSLSNSGAKLLLPPGCPALYRYQLDNGRPNKREYDVGHAAHCRVLGVGEPIVVIGAPDYRTKFAREARDAAHAAGHVPMLEPEYDEVLDMEAAIRAHPIAGPLFDLERGGQAEKTLIWRDPDTDTWLRAMLDWIQVGAGERLIVADYKTTVSAEPDNISKAMFNYGYYRQGAWYLAGAKALGLCGDVEPAFIFIFQEKTPPYLVTVVQPDPEALMWGELKNRQAIDLYAECVATGHWPGYAEDVLSVGLPRWAIRQHTDELLGQGAE